MARSFTLIALAIAAAGFPPAPALAQAPSPLAGVWSLNRSLSEFPTDIGFNPAWMTAATEGVLEGAAPTPAVADLAADTLAAELRPIDDVRSTAEYRRVVAARVLHRLIREARGW
jgi:hypothetical protein